MADEVLDLRQKMQRFAKGNPGADLDRAHLAQRRRALGMIQDAAAGDSGLKIEWLPSRTLLDVARSPETRLISVAPPITDLLRDASDAIPRPEIADLRAVGLPLLGLARFEEPVFPQQGNANLRHGDHVVRAQPMPVLAVAWRLWPGAIEYIAIVSEDDKQQTLKGAERELSEIAGVDLIGKLVPARNGTGIDVDGMGSLVALQPGGDDELAARDNTLTGDQISMTVGESWKHATSFWTRYVLSLAFWISTSAERVPGQETSRAVRRSLDRAGLPVSDVSTIRLRHLEQVDEDAEPGSGSAKVEYSHRWVVSPHWRNQPFGPNRSQRRLTFIAPYIKGPSDKPLIYKDRIWHVDR